MLLQLGLLVSLSYLASGEGGSSYVEKNSYYEYPEELGEPVVLDASVAYGISQINFTIEGNSPFYMIGFVSEGTVCMRITGIKYTDILANVTRTSYTNCTRAKDETTTFFVQSAEWLNGDFEEDIVFVDVIGLDEENRYSVYRSEEQPKYLPDSNLVDSIWWPDSNEYVTFDRVLLLLLILMAVLFELLHTFVTKLLRNRPHGYFSFRLWSRVNSEFMILGFIAFLLWVTERAGGLELLAAHIFPNNGSDILHIVEDTHMRLFMGMVLYYLVTAWVTYVVTYKMQTWGTVYEDVFPPDGHRTEPYSDKEKQNFLVVMKKFGVFLRQNRPERKLGQPGHHGNARNRRGAAEHGELNGEHHRHHHDNFVSDEDIKNFNIGAYFVQTLESMLLDLLAVRFVTWVVFGILTLIVVLLVRYAPAEGKMSNYGVFWVMLGIQLVQLLFVLGVTIFVAVRYNMVVHTDGWIPSQLCCAREAKLQQQRNKCRLERVLLRGVQVSLIMSCYTVLYFCTSVDARLNFEEMGAVTLTYFLMLLAAPFFVIFCIVLPWMLPRFNIVFRTPPFMGEEDMEKVVRIIRGKYKTFFFPLTFAHHHHHKGHKKKEEEHEESKVKQFLEMFDSSGLSYSAEENMEDFKKTAEELSKRHSKMYNHADPEWQMFVSRHASRQDVTLELEPPGEIFMGRLETLDRADYDA